MIYIISSDHFEHYIKKKCLTCIWNFIKESSEFMEHFLDLNLDQYLFSNMKNIDIQEYHFNKYDPFVNKRISWLIYLRIIMENKSLGIKLIKEYKNQLIDKNLYNCIYMTFTGDDYYLITFLLLSIKLFYLYKNELDLLLIKSLNPNTLFIEFLDYIDYDLDLLFNFLISQNLFLEYLFLLLKNLKMNPNEKISNFLEKFLEKIKENKGIFIKFTIRSSTFFY